MGTAIDSVRRYRAAFSLAYAIAEACESVDAPVQITLFNDPEGFSHGRGAWSSERRVIKAWSHKLRNRISAFHVASTFISGGTQLTGAIIASARELSRVQADRKVLLVMTDGQCDHGTASVAKAVTIARSYGIDVCGLGILYDAVKAFETATAYQFIDRIEDLTRDGLRTLVQALK
jgi:hypothetical protein